MSKNLTPKIILIIVLVIVAVWTLYPPSKTLKPGIDLAGGTSLIYEIDTHGLKEAEKKDLSQKLITVLRRRIDPANIQNLLWRPQGSTRFEIQMPLASAEARQKRQNYEKAETDLLDKNVSAAKIMRSLKKSAEERAELFKELAQDDPNRLAILNTLATAHDEREELKAKRDALYSDRETAEAKMSSAGLNLDKINENISNWAGLNDQELSKLIKEFTDVNDNRDLLTGYVKTYTEWSGVSDQFLQKNTQYIEARNSIDQLNLTKDQLDLCLELAEKSPKRIDQIEKLKTNFPDRVNEINRVITAFDEYRPFRGRLDDPKDLQRMLKGAGILEFRILPTQGHPEVDMDKMTSYVERLKELGPRTSSDNQYVWCEIENFEEWKAADREGRLAITEAFGNKYYVLASNKTDESMLHSSGQKEWKLERSNPTTDDMGRRAIGFQLDDRGGNLFFKVTGKNIDRPLCILLDGIAISAPNIETRIRKHGAITGNFTQTEVEDMVNKLNAGSLPARLIEQPISVNTIGPSIGADNRDRGIKAGLIGLVAVIACMAIYYCLAGSIADVALLLNMLFVLAIMAGIRATFTLPGIAGIILTIGMSVDANVLIFERIREEQQRGASLRTAIKNGYERAFSAIFDSNLTTMISAAILYWVASEDIKGFALTLIFGLGSSMFTALFVTRVIFDWLLSKQLIKERLIMLRLITKPNINWMSFRPVFLTISSLLTVGGLAIFFTRNDTQNNKYDIEFTGGTNVQINLKEGANLTRQDVEDKIRKIGIDLNNAALAAANVYSVGESGKQYEISTTETNKMNVTITFPQAGQHSVSELIAAIVKAQDQLAGMLSNLIVTQDTNNAAAFTISTSQMNQSLVKDVLTTAFPDANISEPQVDEIVSNAILTAFADQLEIQQNLQPKIISEQMISEDMIDSYPELIDFLGGIKIECEIQRSSTAGEIIQRFKDLLFKPDMQNIERYPYEILDSSLNVPASSNQPVKSFIYVSTNPEAGFRELSEEERTRFVENEKAKVMAATRLETSLPRVNQISPSVGAEARARALIAIVLSLSALLAYIWLRFGNLRYGLGAVVTLFHDTCATLGAVTGCTYIAGTLIGKGLLIGNFKIDLAMIAAFLTLIGYSLNDTIVIYDRIRENRRKGTLTAQIINDSINETLSRTLLTGITTLVVVLIMYIFGGTRLRGFNFALVFGLIVGTYSSVAISAPVLLFGTKIKKEKGKQKS
jgi:SecD/SecF fusion protein